jgi:hypothetical protein
VAEELGAASVAHGGVGDVAAAAIGLDGDGFPILGLDRELDLVEVGEFLAAERGRSSMYIIMGARVGRGRALDNRLFFPCERRKEGRNTKQEDGKRKKNVA